jgi:hypothetical protein
MFNVVEIIWVEGVMNGILKQVWEVVDRFIAWYTNREHRGVYDIGFPEDYGMGLDSRWRALYGFWVVRNHHGIFAIMEGEQKPWAWPLVRLGVWRDETGRMWVDMKQVFQYEKDEWADLESFVCLDDKSVAKRLSASQGSINKAS